MVSIISPCLKPDHPDHHYQGHKQQDDCQHDKHLYLFRVQVIIRFHAVSFSILAFADSSCAIAELISTSVSE